MNDFTIMKEMIARMDGVSFRVRESYELDDTEYKCIQVETVTFLFDKDSGCLIQAMGDAEYRNEV